MKVSSIVDPRHWDKASIAELKSLVLNDRLTDFAGYASKDDLYRSVAEMGTSTDPEIRGDVRDILYRLDRERAFSFLAECLKDRDDYVRLNAIELLGWYGERITSLLIPLLEKDPFPDIRSGAAAMLGYFGTQEALPALKRAAEHDHESDFHENRISSVAKHAIRQIKARYREGGNPDRYRDVAFLGDELRIDEQEDLD